jgi:hypothetical protein
MIEYPLFYIRSRPDEDLRFPVAKRDSILVPTFGAYLKASSK